MEEEEYQDYLVDRAKKILEQQTETEEVEVPDTEFDDKVEKAEEQGRSKIPLAFDPREIRHLANNRKSMSNKEMKEFLEKDSELQEELRELDEWNGFTRWEERFMIQNNLDMEPDEIAEQLDREEKKVRMKMRMLGLNVDF